MAAIWKNEFNLESLNNLNGETLGSNIGLEFTEFGDDYLCARIPVDGRTKQPAGILHGGASCVLAETLGSVASALCIDISKQKCVGLEINASHLKPAFSGYVTGTCKPVRIGKTMHVWQIDIRNDAGQLTCVSRLTVAII